MKYLKTYENKKYKYRKGDVVICIRKDLTSTPTPQYGKPYIVTKISRNNGFLRDITYLTITDKEKTEFGTWNAEVFVPEIEWNINKFNI